MTKEAGAETHMHSAFSVKRQSLAPMRGSAGPVCGPEARVRLILTNTGVFLSSSRKLGLGGSLFSEWHILERF